MDWKRTFSRVKAALRRRGRSEHDAEDLLQEAWLRMARHGQSERVLNPEAFLMRAALNLSIDAHRRSVRSEEVALDDVLLVDVAPGAEAVLLGKERMERLAACLARLPERSREIFLAHRVDGRSYTDIARELGISATAVEKHVAKATLLLTSWMEGW